MPITAADTSTVTRCITASFRDCAACLQIPACHAKWDEIQKETKAGFIHYPRLAITILYTNETSIRQVFCNLPVHIRNHSFPWLHRPTSRLRRSKKVQQDVSLRTASSHHAVDHYKYELVSIQEPRHAHQSVHSISVGLIQTSSTASTLDSISIACAYRYMTRLQTQNCAKVPGFKPCTLSLLGCHFMTCAS